MSAVDGGSRLLALVGAGRLTVGWEDRGRGGRFGGRELVVRGVVGVGVDVGVEDGGVGFVL